MRWHGNRFDANLPHMSCCRLQESEAARATKEREATAALTDREAMKARFLFDGCWLYGTAAEVFLDVYRV